MHYHNDMDRSLNETTTDKIRTYRTDYNTKSPSSVTFIPVIPSTSGRSHSKFVRLLFSQTHRETDIFFPPSSVRCSPLSLNRKLTTFSPDFNTVDNCCDLLPLYTEYWWCTCDFQITHSPIKLTNLSFINVVYVFRCYSSPCHPVYVT